MSSEPRRSLQGAFVPREGQAATDFAARMQPETRNVVDVLVHMGYGGSRQEAGEAIGQAGDEGIDGSIKEDRLGLDIIYIQAKRWAKYRGASEVQRFAGGLAGKRARKGVFITTSSFSGEAVAYAASCTGLTEDENLR